MMLMIVVLLLVGWYVSGLVGCGLSLAKFWRAGNDLTLEHIVMLVLVGVFGPFVLVAVLNKEYHVKDFVVIKRPRDKLKGGGK